MLIPVIVKPVKNLMIANIRKDDENALANPKTIANT